MTWRVPLADVVIADEDLEAVLDTYRSGWLSMGPRTEEPEAAFAHYTGARHAVAAGRAFPLVSNKICGVGGGGLAPPKDDALAGRRRLLPSHGMTPLTWDRRRGHSSTYDVVALGFNSRMDERRAALAGPRLARLD